VKPRILSLISAAVVALAGGLTLNTASIAQEPGSGPIDPAVLKSYSWRSIGLRDGRDATRC